MRRTAIEVDVQRNMGDVIDLFTCNKAEVAKSFVGAPLATFELKTDALIDEARSWRPAFR